MVRGNPPHWIFLTEVNSVNSHCHLPHAPQKKQRDYGDDEHRAPPVTWEAPLGITIIPFQLPQHHRWLEPPGQHLWPNTAPAPHQQGQEKPLEQTGHHRQLHTPLGQLQLPSGTLSLGTAIVPFPPGHTPAPHPHPGHSHPGMRPAEQEPVSHLTAVKD